MTASVAAQVQTGGRVVVTLTGLATETNVSEWTLWRDDLDHDRVPVRGFYRRTDLVDVVAYDYEAPLARPVFYVLEVLRTTGGRTEYANGPVTIPATRPVLSNPVTGASVELAAVETWPELSYNGRTQVIPVVGRTDPVVVSDAGTLPSSQPVIRTDDVGARREVRELLMPGGVVLLRAPEVDVEDAYLAVTEWAEQRLTNSPADVRRRHQLTALHASAPGIGLPASGDTLADLEAAVPTTLLALSQTFSTLLEIAAADLEAV